MLVGKSISFKHTEKCEPYESEDGKRWLSTKEVVIVGGIVIDKYRGSFQGLDAIRDVFNYALVDFYLVSDSEGVLYHVLPKDITKIW